MVAPDAGSAAVPGPGSARTYQVRTYGCQMNVHDSERLAGLLEAAGYLRAPDGADADVVVFNTCAVRENADNKLYGNLSHLAPRKRDNPDLQIAVGGCLAQKDREAVLSKAPWVDVVFGTHNLGSLPTLLDRARPKSRSPRRCANSRHRCRRLVTPDTPLGFPSPSAATTAAPSASCRRCAARKSTGHPTTSLPRCSRWWTAACSR
jgi:tRNA A37 methylthiotransferase MiaB